MILMEKFDYVVIFLKFGDKRLKTGAVKEEFCGRGTSVSLGMDNFRYLFYESVRQLFGSSWLWRGFA